MIPIKIKSKNDFVTNFLSPISKLTENTVLKVRDSNINAVCSSSDGTLIVNCTTEQQNEVDETLFLNVPDVNRLIKVMSCIPDDDIIVNFNNNNIEYKSENVGFKFHLLEDGIIDPPAVDIEKIKKIDFNFKFQVTPDVVSQLVRGSTFTTDTNKIYFSTDNNKVLASLTDRQRHNTDSFTQLISEKYTGDPLTKELALSFETIRIISSIRFEELIVNINPDLNVFLFQIVTKSATIMVISSGFVG